ncbi:MAG: O-antigen ligase family protein [Pyrinomonadaceae bacterium]|nr:O-antigen ligase family protein [Pyrinomonadaceae bacterium]MDQ3256200.1 O-antigen ligase family protein [Acidobacteriota bacterium]
MTSSIFNASAAPAVVNSPTLPDAASSVAPTIAVATPLPVNTEPVRTLASRFIILMLCIALVLSALAFGTVHSWSLGALQMSAGAVVFFWYVDGWRSKRFRVSRNVLQWPLLGLVIIGLVQLLPLGGGGGNIDAGFLSAEPVRSLSLDPYTTRLVVVQIASLLVYFAAALAFIDTPRRLRLIARVIIIFGFVLAMFSMMQFFVSPDKIFGIRESKQALGFGPFINRHHFAGYMELTMGLPLGLLLAGAIEGDRRLLYGFAAGLMGVALVMTNSRGGIISLAAEILFLFTVFGVRYWKRSRTEDGAAGQQRRLRAVIVSVALCFTLIIGIFSAALFFGGEASLSRLLGTVNADDPTTGRAHFWSVTLNIIHDHPVIGAGLGAFGVAYTRYDTRNGLYRLEQAHNDYLQALSDAGIIGAALGIFFVVALFRMGFTRAESKDKFRRGIATGALAGCFAVLVHSFFDFTLHTTSNALLFLVLAALATINGRVEQVSSGRRKRRRRKRIHSDDPEIEPAAITAPALETLEKV